jgi:hypothetical protein
MNPGQLHNQVMARILRHIGGPKPCPHKILLAGKAVVETTSAYVGTVRFHLRQ